MRQQDISRTTRIKEELRFSFWMHGIEQQLQFAIQINAKQTDNLSAREGR